MTAPEPNNNPDGHLRADAEVCTMLAKLIDSSQAVDVDWEEPAPELENWIESLGREQVLGLLLAVLRRWHALTDQDAGSDRPDRP
ncbi:hypothetical protein NG895_18210 [Aeoliella sp. ICT_H6.2]|uniref:Uncharacterized protein n=1 Tax=Aeoliella straminimaris TaxID=2954799 RepID=A0A9X2JHU6_9BACT|nr:hypothetical protein [Aeoliella straminimaris]MCO6045837.1 hypothetical protein [Aeoliella straminimaris]